MRAFACGRCAECDGGRGYEFCLSPRGGGGAPEPLEQAKQRILSALEIAMTYGGVDGAHHNAWVIDQMVRALSGPEYPDFVARACEGEDGPNTYEWSTGVAP